MTSTASRLDRISVDPAIVHGRPLIRGTRITVQVILELLAADETVDELLSEYDELTRDDIFAALDYAASVAGGAKVITFVARPPCRTNELHRGRAVAAHPRDALDCPRP